MSAENGRLGRIATLAFGAAALIGAALPLNPAQAQTYLGWDFGRGLGIGVGTPPSAYARCPDYGWGPAFTYRCRVAHSRYRYPARRY